MKLSVIICTHNPRRDYLAATLAGLRAQTLPANEWEFLLIDNASEVGRAPDVDLGWHPGARLIREDKLGLTPARLRGIREAQGDLLVFVDDDNILDPDYLEVAVKIASEKSYLGSWSGQCRGRFDEEPPEWTRRYWGNLAIREFKEDRWSNLPRLGETMPCGAGMCVRRGVALHYLKLNESGQRSFQFDRTGSSLVSGGDNDLAACACDLGLGVGLMTSLKLQHLIPPVRLTADYLARLAEGIHFSGIILDYARGIDCVKPSFLRSFVSAIRRLFINHRHAKIQKFVVRGQRKAFEFINQKKL